MKKLNKKILFAPWAANNINYFSYQNWYLPLKKLFREIRIFDPQEEMYNYGKDIMNIKFLEMIEKEKPDYIFLWLIYEEFYIDTLLRIKEIYPKAKVLNFFGDDDILFDNYSLYMSRFVDYPLASHYEYFHNYSKKGIKNAFFTCGVNTKSFRLMKCKKKYDVTFIGTPMSDRPEYVRYLIKNGVNVKIFGKGWDKYPDLMDYYGGSPTNEEAIKIINESRINLSFTKNYQNLPGFKARVFEIGACKSFLLTEEFTGYLKFLKNKKEIVMFKDKDDLLDKIKYYLINDKKRKDISNNSYKKIQKKYSQLPEFLNIFKKISYIKENKRTDIPEYKVITLYEKDLKEDRRFIKNKIKEYDYVSFLNNGDEELKYRKDMQVYALEKSNKPINCCDYYISSRISGDYLSLYSNHAFKTLKKEIFLNTLRISQIVVKKSFFLDNIDLFLNFESKKNKIISENKLSFLRYPLIRSYHKLNLSDSDKNKVCLPIFENKLRVVKNKGFLFMRSYTYKIIMSSIFDDSFIYTNLKKRFLPN